MRTASRSTAIYNAAFQLALGLAAAVALALTMMVTCK